MVLPHHGFSVVVRSGLSAGENRYATDFQSCGDDAGGIESSAVGFAEHLCEHLGLLIAGVDQAKSEVIKLAALAQREHGRVTGLQASIHQDGAVTVQPGCFGQFRIGCNPSGNDHQVGADQGVIVELNRTDPLVTE